MSKVSQNIFLIGPMGSGKTTIGKQLAKMLGLEFYDCDHELERLTGASVNLIFDVEGEAGFPFEGKSPTQTAHCKNGVLIATGGGTICNEENRRMLRSRGLVVYLEDQYRKSTQTPEPGQEPAVAAGRGQDATIAGSRQGTQSAL